MTGTSHRLVEVPPERLARWVHGFARRHPGTVVAVEDGDLVLRSRGDAVAVLETPWPTEDLWPAVTGPDIGPPVPVLPVHGGTASVGGDPTAPGTVDHPLVRALVDHAAAPRTALLVLVRRGGFGAALAREGTLLTHRLGTRYVQGRTAAGGWSQQRFARRRAGQASALAGAAAAAVATVLEHPVAPDVVVPGGDRALVAEVLATPGCRSVAALPRGPLLDVRDPRLAVLQDVAGRCRSVRIRLTQPDGD